MFYWTRGNESVSGLDTLKLAQYTVEDHYTSVSEAIYETGEAVLFKIKVSLFIVLFYYFVIARAQNHREDDRNMS